MDRNKAAKTVVKALLVIVILFVGWLTYTIYKLMHQPVVIVIGAALAAGLRALMIKIDEDPDFMSMTTEERTAMIHKQKSIIDKISGMIIPAIIILIIFSSNPAVKKSVKKLFNAAVKEAQKEMEKSRGSGAPVNKLEKKLIQGSEQKDGVVTEKYPDGKKKMVYTVKNGRKDGKLIVYSEEGKVTQEWNYDDGLLQGESYIYYPSGKIWKVQAYKDGKLNGEYRVYDENGKVIDKRIYKNNIEEGMRHSGSKEADERR